MLYQGGLVVQKENEPQYYIAGLDALCGGNLIEGDVTYMAGGTFGTSTGKPAMDAILRNMDGYQQLRDQLDGRKGSSGGKTLANTVVSNATLCAKIALGDGPIGGILGDTQADKDKNIYINRQPLRDHGTGVLTYQGTAWEERLGEAGQAPSKITRGITNNVDGNVDLPRILSGGGQFFHQVTITNPKADKASVRLLIKALVSTDNKQGNQQQTSVSWGINVKRETATSWQSAGTFSFTGKSSDPIVQERLISAPAATSNPAERWQFQIYRITADSTNDKVQNDTAFNGHVEIQSVDLAYDGSNTSAPSALLSIAIDLSQFSQGGNYPEVSVRVRGRKVRVPTNYDPVARTYTGNWDGSWKTAATQNPVWHWLHIATETKQGLGMPDDFFNRYELYQIAKFNDEAVNGRPRYTLNKQFREAQDGWPFLVELASSFRAAPYFDGNRIVLIQDRPNTPITHYVNNTMVADGFFNYQNVELGKQFNEVLVNWIDNEDFGTQKTVRYRDEDSIARNRAAGLGSGGVIRATFDKVGCTNKQEAYDFARMLAFVSQKENETVTFDTLLGAAAYSPGQLIEIDDIIVANKQFMGRAYAGEAGGIRLEQPWTQKENTTYTLHVVLNNQLVIRSIPMVQKDTTSTLVPCDASGVEFGTPFGVVEQGGAQPRVFRITNIADSGAGKYQVTAKVHIEGKYAYVEQNVPVPTVPYSDLKRNSFIPAPTGLRVSHSFAQDEAVGSRHKLSLSWDAITDPKYPLKGYKVEVFKPDNQWYPLYEGMMNVAVIEDAKPGKYTFSVKPINSFDAGGEPASISYELVYGQGNAILRPPIFVGFD